MGEEARLASHGGESPLLMEIQVGLCELASARDYLMDGGDSFSGIRRMEDAIHRIDDALRALRLQAMSLLLDLSAAEDEGNMARRCFGWVIPPCRGLDLVSNERLRWALEAS